MMHARFFICILIILCGTATIFFVGCKQRESAKLTISVEGRELSDAHIYIDKKYFGSLTQTVILSDGKVYINSKLATKLHDQDSGNASGAYTGCSDPIHLSSGKHAIKLQKGEAQLLINVTENISTGHHLLTILPEKGLVKWDNVPFQIGPEKAVAIASEKTK
jgi:hypothetical protein